MNVNILFFGELADAAKACYGSEKLSKAISSDSCSLHQLEAALSDEHKTLADIFARNEHLCAVNQEMTREDEALKDGDEIAFMSPFSGG